MSSNGWGRGTSRGFQAAAAAAAAGNTAIPTIISAGRIHACSHTSAAVQTAPYPLTAPALASGRQGDGGAGQGRGQKSSRRRERRDKGPKLHTAPSSFGQLVVEEAEEERALKLAMALSAAEPAAAEGALELGRQLSEETAEDERELSRALALSAAEPASMALWGSSSDLVDVASGGVAESARALSRAGRQLSEGSRRAMAVAEAAEAAELARQAVMDQEMRGVQAQISALMAAESEGTAAGAGATAGEPGRAPTLQLQPALFIGFLLCSSHFGSRSHAG